MCLKCYQWWKLLSSWVLCHYEGLFWQLRWPALRWRWEITSLTMFHKLLHSRPEPLESSSANVCFSMQVLPQLAAAASHSNWSSHKHAPHATENLFSTDRLFYGTHSSTTYNHSRIVNHFAMLSRNTTNHINLPQQKTFTNHSPLHFLSLQIVCT